MKGKKLISVFLASVMLLCVVFSSVTATSAKTISVKPTKVTAISQTDITTLRISWSKVSGVNGYVLYYSTNGSRFKKLTTTKSRSYYHKKLKNGVKYYYKLKTYKKYKGKNKYSKYSNIKAKSCTNNLVNIYKPYRTRNYELCTGLNKLMISGKSYSNGFKLKTSVWDEESFADYNLSGKYSSVKFTFGYLDDGYTSAEDTLYILSDNEEVASYKLRAGDLARTVKINIRRANKLEFYVKNDIGSNVINEYIGFANISLYK